MIEVVKGGYRGTLFFFGRGERAFLGGLFGLGEGVCELVRVVEAGWLGWTRLECVCLFLYVPLLEPVMVPER